MLTWQIVGRGWDLTAPIHDPEGRGEPSFLCLSGAGRRMGGLPYFFHNNMGQPLNTTASPMPLDPHVQS